jgi:2-keto-4-pentenoate hydratase/2-oxohepta-3-ene-1,7-dioic acid hydratase in catechol pathway
MKIICIGRNYANHIEELQNERPTDQLFYETWFGDFIKTTSFVIRIFGRYSSRNRNYIKLRVGKYIEPKFAHKYYEEISVGLISLLGIYRPS